MSRTRIDSPTPVVRRSDAPGSGAAAIGFADIGVPTAMVAALAARGIHEPFAIQSATLPDSLAGRDVLGRGRTGSGKTVAFALPLVAALAQQPDATRPGAPRGLVLVPTRELATQVEATVGPLARAMGLRTTVIFGGVSQAPQARALKAGTDIVVATPGRLQDLIEQRIARLGDVRVTVLDEADHMADLGFLPVVKRLLDQTPRGGQRLLFSATLDSGIDVLARRYLTDPVTHSVDNAQSPVPAMDHHVFAVSTDERAAVVRQLVAGEGRTLAFTRTKHQARKWARQLTAAGVPAVDLHGNLSQNARQRNLTAFASGDVRVLVATDIAARGIHVDDVSLVVHVDPPAEHKAYLHRSGRTARAGAGGVVVTIGTPEQRGDINQLMRRAAIRATHHSVRPGDPTIEAIAGPPAAPSHPAAVTATATGSPTGNPSRSPRRSGTGEARSGRPARAAREPAPRSRPRRRRSTRPASAAPTRP